MAEGNLGSLFFDMNIRTSEAQKGIKKLITELSKLDLAAESGRKTANAIYGAFNSRNGKEIAEDFKNVSAQMNLQAQEAANLSARMRELSQIKEAMLRRDREAGEHGAFVAMQQEARAADELLKRRQRLAESVNAYKDFFDNKNAFGAAGPTKSKEAIEAARALRALTRETSDATIKKLESSITESEAHLTSLGKTLNEILKMNPAKTGMTEAFQQLSGTYHGLQEYTNLLYQQLANVNNGFKSYADSLVKAAPTEEEHLRRQRELTNAFESHFRAQEQATAAEKRNAEATMRANQARRDALATSRSSGEKLISDRIKELEAQRRELQQLWTSGKGVLSVDEIQSVRTAYHQVTQELLSLRAAMQQVGSYSIKDLFATGRGATDYTPFVSGMKNAVESKREAIRLERKHQEEVAKTAARVRGDLARAFEQAKGHAQGLSSTMRDLQNLVMQGGLVYGAQQFMMSVIQTGGELEKQHIALQAILGDMQNADTMFGQIKELALSSPFTFSELNKDVKQLAAYGVEYDHLYDTTKRLADMSSGLGVSFERIALAFGQVQARGWLDGKELRQIAYAGIPLLDKLSEYYSKREGQKVSTSEVKSRITGRGVSFEDVKNVFWEMTDAGGQFYNMQQVLSETLLGRYNKLKDAWEIMLSDFASGSNIVGKTLKGAIELVTTLVQSLHTMGPVVAAAFSGFGLRKLQTALGGGIGEALLKGKGSMAADIQRKALLGEKISPEEVRILQTKKQITAEDLRSLAAVKALTKADLDRLYVNGKITRELYQQSLAQMQGGSSFGKRREMVLMRQQGGWWNTAKLSIMKLQLQTDAYFTRLKVQVAQSGSMWAPFAAKGLSAISLVGTGIKTLGATMWAALGGLPGLIITGVTMGLGYLYSKNAELKRAMEQTADEIEDRIKTLRDFIRDSKTQSVIDSGDEKEMANLIDSYKEKLKEIAPYNYNNLVMTAEEKKGHAERLQYLDAELRRLQAAEKIAKTRLGHKDDYKRLKNVLEYTSGYYAEVDKRAARNVKEGMSADAARGKAVTVDNYARFHAEQIKKVIEKQFGDIGKDELMRSAAMQAMDSIFTNMGVPQDKADIIKASVLQAFGVGDKDAWLQSEVSERMRSAIDKAAPAIGDKIRSGQTLTKAEQDKVKELMADARQGLTKEYPEFERTLQQMLAQSKFKAVISLVYETGDRYNDTQSEMLKRVPDMPLMLKDTENKYRSYAKKWGKEDSWYAARNAARADIDAAFNEYDSAKKSGAANAGELYTKWDAVKKAAKAILKYDYEGEGKKSNKAKHTGSQEDVELKRLQERIRLYKKLYQEIKKTEDLYGKGGALDKLRQDGEFKSLFKDKKRFPITNMRDYDTSIKQILSTLPSSTEERRHFKEEQLADIQTENRKMEEEGIRDSNTELERQLSLLAEKYDIYEKLFKLTGDKGGAMSVAFGGTLVQSDTMLDYLMGELAKYLPEANARSKTNLTIDDVLGMDESGLDRMLGKDSKDISVVVKKLKSEQDKVQKKTIDEIAEILETNATLEQQIADEVRAYERQKSKISSSDVTPAMKERALSGLAEAHNKKMSDLKFEKFKKDNDWVTVFDDLDRVSTKTIEDMITNIDDFSKKGNLSVEVVKSLRDALGKLRTESIERNPLPTILGATSRGNAIGSYLKTAVPDANGRYTLNDEQAKKMGLQAGKGYTKAELENEQQGAYDDFAKGISGLQAKFKALQDCLQPVIDLFDSLGMADTPVGESANIASNALGAASQVAGGLNAFGGALSSAGPYGAAAAATLSVLSGIFALHDKALQKDIEASERRQKDMENMLKNVKTVIEDTLGGIYNYRMDSETRATLRKVLENDKKQYAQDTRKAASDAMQDTSNSYLAEKASLLAQRDELMRQQKDENSKKKKDQDKLDDYKQQIAEINQQIKQMSTDFLKDMYSVDMKSWASQLTDAVVGAWEKGEDAMDAYRDKAKELVRDLTKNILTQKIMEAALEKPLGYLTSLIEQKGKLDEADMPKIVDDLAAAGENAVSSITAVMDALKAKGYDFTESGSGSVTNSVKSITEETADVLASCLNAIRLDVSVNRANMERVGELLREQLPEMGQIQKAQLGQLTQLVVLAEARNEKLEQITDWMTAVSTGGRKKVYVS